MPKVEVRYEDNEIPKRLTKIAHEKGYSSREEFLRDVHQKIAYEEFETATSALYRQALERVTEVEMALVEVLQKNIELGLIQVPVIIGKKEDDKRGKQ